MTDHEAADQSLLRLSKDLFSGAMGGIAQVLIGECISVIMCLIAVLNYTSGPGMCL
jgi:hypothetical protein